MKYALKSVPGIADIGVPMEMGMAPELHPDVWRGQKKFKITNFTMPNNISYIQYSLKSVPDLADVGVPHGVGDGPRAPPRSPRGSGKNFKWLISLCPTISLL